MVIVGFGIIFAVLCILYSRSKLESKSILVEDAEKGLALQIEINGESERIYLTDAGDNGDIFFLPSYVSNNDLYMDMFDGEFYDENGE